MDSPLSEPDSLSSPGATTEPLPNSEADDLQLSSSPPPTRRSRSRSLHGPEPRAGTGAGGGAESDSSLTEQSDSEVEPSALNTVEEGDDEMEEAAGGAASELGDDEQEDDDEDEPVQRTPRGNKRPRPIALGDEDEDGVGDELSRPARKRVGSPSASNEPSVVSNHKDALATAKTASPPSSAKRARPVEDDSVASSSASTVGAPPAAPRPAPAAATVAAAPSSADSLSELDDDDDDEPQSTRPAPKPSSAPTAAPASDADDDDVAPARSTSPKSKKVASRVRGNGRPRGLGARGRPRAVATKPSAAARSESPLSTVGSSAGEDKAEDEVEADVDMEDAPLVENGLAGVGEGAAAGPARVGDEEAVKELEVEASAVEALAAAAADASTTASARSAAVKGRAKAKGKSKGKTAGKAAGETMRRSTSNESSVDAPKHLGNGTSPSNSAFTSLPALPAPSGLVELETAPDAVANQLAELAEAEADVAADAAAASASGATSAAAADDTSAPMDGVEAGDSQLTGADGLDEERADAVVEEVEEEQRPVPPPSAKKGAIGKKGGKKGKGKEKAAPVPVEDGEEDEPVEGEEEEDTSDDAFMRKRAEAMEALTKIEISFARLRDLLYLERLADVEKERLAIETGAHPELVHLTQLIELRRNRKLELARLWLDGLENAYGVQFTDREHANWNSWQDDRARERTRMLDDANSKRRRLEREKRALERPKDDSLASMLAPRPPPVVPLHHRRRVGFDADPLDDNEIAWSLRHPDVRVDASVRGLDDEATYGDLERMGLREPIRHPLFPYDAVYAHATGLGGPTYGDSRGAHLGYPYGGGGYDGAAHAMHQQHPHPHQGFSSAFSSLPPLPQHQRVESGPPRPPSNPRVAQGFPAELGGGQPGYPAASRAHGNGHYPQTYAEIEAWQQQQQQQQQQHQSRHGGFDDERRRRTLSAGGSLAPNRSHESLDAVAAHRQNGYTPAASSAAGQDGDPTGGRTTPTHASAAAKARFTLDEHMSTRSPKGPASVSSVASSASKAPTTTGVSVAAASPASAAAAAAAARSNPPAFMAIPAIPPFDRNRHEQTIRARAAAAATGGHSGGSSPAPPVLPPLKQQPTPTSTPLFPPHQQAKQQQAPTQAQGQGSFSAYAVPQRAA
ncbi:hypothetical protein JCM8208_006113 [Rhodotorula glutinis]